MRRPIAGCRANAAWTAGNVSASLIFPRFVAGPKKLAHLSNSPMPDSTSYDSSADRNLLFGVLALQADLVDPERFVRACTMWSAQKATPLADLLVQQGWLTPEGRADVERL